ncbi:MAG: hypothetical protein AAGL99_18830, partial [Pseudomonadota bacterium]
MKTGAPETQKSKSAQRFADNPMSHYVPLLGETREFDRVAIWRLQRMTGKRAATAASSRRVQGPQRAAFT